MTGASQAVALVVAAAQTSHVFDWCVHGDHTGCHATGANQYRTLTCACPCHQEETT